jgi:hypothetical protein
MQLLRGDTIDNLEDKALIAGGIALGILFLKAYKEALEGVVR